MSEVKRAVCTNQEPWASTVTMATNLSRLWPIAARHGLWSFIPAGVAIVSTLHQPWRSWEEMSKVLERGHMTLVSDVIRASLIDKITLCQHQSPAIALISSWLGNPKALVNVMSFPGSQRAAESGDAVTQCVAHYKIRTASLMQTH